jgi:nucleoside-diphosphate-sugar epimerase
VSLIGKSGNNKKMKVLIVGNLGYIGPVVIDHLHETHPDFKLYGYDIGFFTGNETSIQGLLPETKLAAQYYGDVRKFDSTILRGMDAVVYLAAISNDPMGNVFEEPTFDINHICAVKIAREAKKEGVERFIFASSCSVYGLADSQPRNESSEVNPLTAYAKSKVQAEIDLKPLADENFFITCFRFATACGMSSRLRLDLVLNDFVACALVNKKIEILSDGRPWRPLINVKDMARAMEWGIIRKDQPNYIVVNAGSDEWNYQVIDLAKAVQKLMPEIEIKVNPNAQPDNRSYKVDFSLFKKIAKDFYPQYSLERTISELINGLNEIGFQNQDFRNSQFIRLKTLNNLIQKQVINQKLEAV